MHTQREIQTVVDANVIDWKDCSETSTCGFLAGYAMSPLKNYATHNFRLYLLTNSEYVYWSS